MIKDRHRLRQKFKRGRAPLKKSPSKADGVMSKSMALAERRKALLPTPSFPEALLVHMIDILDAKMNLMDIALNEDQEPGKFTNRHNYFRIPLLKKDEPE